MSLNCLSQKWGQVQLILKVLRNFHSKIGDSWVVAQDLRSFRPLALGQQMQRLAVSSRERSILTPNCGVQTDGSIKSLEGELRFLLGTGRDAAIMARRCGLDGKGCRTLDHIGREFGLTRERVRQIVQRESNGLSARKLATPVFDRTIRAILDRLPAPANRVEAELCSAGLTENPFELEGIEKAAVLLGRSAPFSITRVRGIRVAHPQAISFLKSIDHLARGAVRRWGLATISEVVSLARASGLDQCTNELVESALTSQESFRWLDREKESGWFWLSDVCPNRLSRRIKKVLSVANPIGVMALRSSISRDYRMGSRVPSPSILLKFCLDACELQQQDDGVYANQGPGLRPVLSATELYVAGLLRNAGGVMTKTELMSRWRTQYSKRKTLYQLLAYSPIICRYSEDAYSLVGTAPQTTLERCGVVHYWAETDNYDTVDLSL